MKIKEIKRNENHYSFYTVTFTPKWIEKLFGVEEKQKEYKATGDNYVFGGNEYITKNGKSLRCGHWVGEAIDKWRRAW